RLDEALARYQDCILRKPDYFEAHFAIGLILEREGKLAEAVASYRRAVETGPQFAPAHLALAVALDRTGDRAGALRHAEHAVRLAPGDPVPKKYLDRFRKEPGS
ncbi:MAG: tetratricopeptide repeat protein, partial [Pirellulaceae bacterium]